jgi:hypothetical protein
MDVERNRRARDGLAMTLKWARLRRRARVCAPFVRLRVSRSMDLAGQLHVAQFWRLSDVEEHVMRRRRGKGRCGGGAGWRA